MPTATSQLLENLAAYGTVQGQLRGQSRPLDFGDVAAEYQALTAGVGVAPVLDITSIDVTGADRATFLHSMCTADVKALAPGDSCEAIFTNAQGHVVGYGWLHGRDDRITIDLVGGNANTLVAELDRYIIRERVTLVDRTNDLATLLVAGPAAEKRLATEKVSGTFLEKIPDTFLAAVFCRRVELAGTDSFLLSADARHVAALWDELVGAGARPCGCQAVETRRIERGIPLFGVDITSENLPQEVARDERTISFTKGCYIGQETVARIDALGHVNRTLGGLKFDRATSNAEIKAGSELAIDGKTVARITSVAYSPQLDATLALAYLRRGHERPGTILATDTATAEVVALPV
jgi:folate-binding protein YgfZ